MLPPAPPLIDEASCSAAESVAATVAYILLLVEETHQGEDPTGCLSRRSDAGGGAAACTALNCVHLWTKKTTRVHLKSSLTAVRFRSVCEESIGASGRRQERKKCIPDGV